jgi:hypothetical protein
LFKKFDFHIPTHLTNIASKDAARKDPHLNQRACRRKISATLSAPVTATQLQLR